MNTAPRYPELLAILPGSDGESLPCPTGTTGEELIRFLRIPEISKATDYRHVVESLKHAHGLPRIHLCGTTVCLTDSVKAWLEKHVICGQ